MALKINQMYLNTDLKLEKQRFFQNIKHSKIMFDMAITVPSIKVVRMTI